MSDWLKQQADALAGQPDFELEKLVLTLHRQITERMEQLEMNRSDLARAMSVGRWSVSRLLNNVSNLELRTLVKAASALKCRLTLELKPVDEEPMSVNDSRVTHVLRRVEFPAVPQSTQIVATARPSAASATVKLSDPRRVGKGYAPAA
jgi:transcriptional regulator with XRE-family HTH domain